MNSIKKRFLVFAVAGVAATVLTMFVSPSVSIAAISSWQKAASMVPRYSEDFASDSFKQSLRNLKAANANTVSLIVPYYTSNCQSSDVGSGGNTPTTASLTSAISYARSIGMQVNLKPHLEAHNPWGGGNCVWRANINPTDRNTFFTNYRNMLHGLAALGPDELTIGAELINLSSARINPDNTTRWRNIISSLRTAYPGIRLNYSSNWGSGDFATESNQIEFWSDLDDIGISGYYEHWTPSDNPISIQEVKDNWERWNSSNIRPLNRQFNKPVKFTEVGYQSADDARQQPWNYDYRWFKGYDADEQAKLFEALFQYWDTQSFFTGVNLWHWDTDPNAGGVGNADYTPQRKPAEEIIRQYFAGGTTPTPNPTPPPPPPASVSFTSSASVTPTSPTAGQPLTVNATVTNTSGAPLTDLIVDLEIHNSSNAKIHQVFHGSQNFTANEAKNFSFTWTPSSAGTYTVVVGVFNNNWTVNHHWNGSARNFTVGSGDTTPPPPPLPPPSGSCPTTTPSGSFNACYFNNIDLTGFAVSRNETAINHDWGAGSPHSSVEADTFSARWRGSFNFEAATYDFTVRADDGVRVWIDSTQVLDRWIDQPATTYTFSRALTAGAHTVRVEYYENGGGAVAQVSWARQTGTTPPPPPPGPTPPPPPPPSSSTVEIWWPTNGATISGTQPFQAVLSNADVSTYNMFWQVDGGVLNQMHTDTAGYPHKRAWVDVSGWNWKGAGPYRINFVARNLSGATIAQRSIDINVAR